MSDDADPKDLPEGQKGATPSASSSSSPDETPYENPPVKGSPSASSFEDEDERLRALVKRAVGRTKKAEGDTPPSGISSDVATDEAAEAAFVDEVDLKDALRGALRPTPGAVAPSLLGGVQRKLRMRSRGKFYGDGWSTSDSPKTTYLVTSVIMLVLVAIVFLALVPWSSASLP